MSPDYDDSALPVFVSKTWTIDVNGFAISISSYQSIFFKITCIFYQDCSSLAWCLFRSLLKELLSVLVMIFLSIFRVTGSANS